MSGAEEVYSPAKKEEEMGRTQGIRVELKKPKHHKWLLERFPMVAYKHNVRKYRKEYEIELRQCVKNYQYIYLFKCNDYSSRGFQIFQEVLWPSSRFLLDGFDDITKTVLSAELLKLAPNGDIGFCFSNLHKWQLVREISNYEEFYIPHGPYYDRFTVIFRKGYLMAGDAGVLLKNLTKLKLDDIVDCKKGVELERITKDGAKDGVGVELEGIFKDGRGRVELEGITRDVVYVKENIVSCEANLRKSNYLGHHSEFLDLGLPSSYTPTLLGCWKIDEGALEIYPDTLRTSDLKSKTWNWLLVA